MPSTVLGYVLYSNIRMHFVTVGLVALDNIAICDVKHFDFPQIQSCCWSRQPSCECGCVGGCFE